MTVFVKKPNAHPTDPFISAWENELGKLDASNELAVQLTQSLSTVRNDPWLAESRLRRTLVSYLESHGDRMAGSLIADDASCITMLTSNRLDASRAGPKGDMKPVIKEELTRAATELASKLVRNLTQNTAGKTRTR